MSFKCQTSPTKLTFNNNVFAKNCDFRLIIILCVIGAAILPIIKCAKLENPQIRLLINDDDLLQEKTNRHEASSAADALRHTDNSGEHFNLYRSELKRLSYETIHRILRDENEPSYRREETELRYYQKRSPSYDQNHQLIKRATEETDAVLNLSQQNLTEFRITSQIQQRLPSISALNLTNNHLKEFNISLLNNATNLNILNLQNNSLTAIPLNSAAQLRTLNLNNNLIATSNLTSNLYLKNLYMSGNRIENMSSIHFPLLKNLETLDVSHNLLENTESPFFTERMHNLKHLNVAYNQMILVYREAFYNLLSLNTLLLSHNNIHAVDYETFLGLPNLQYLDLSHNDLQAKTIRALQGITGLEALSIAFNPNIGSYMQEFVASWSLKALDASATGLCKIPAALAQAVRSLKLRYNFFKVINCGDLDSYPLLQYLDLSFSYIENIEDDALGRLEILEILMLDHNKLRKVPFSLPVSLEHLFLQNNEIMEIPQQAFQGLINLETLDLSHNKLLYLPDIMLPKLQTLNLQSSEIRGISQGIIHSLPKLNDLMLEDNPIRCSDLLGIAEWASTCRLRVYQAAEKLAEDNFVLRIQNLKNKFEKQHNFYEQFRLHNTFENDTLLSYFKPSCEPDNVAVLANNVRTYVEQRKESYNPPKFNLEAKSTNRGKMQQQESKTTESTMQPTTKQIEKIYEPKLTANVDASNQTVIESTVDPYSLLGAMNMTKEEKLLKDRQRVEFYRLTGNPAVRYNFRNKTIPRNMYSDPNIIKSLMINFTTTTAIPPTSTTSTSTAAPLATTTSIKAEALKQIEQQNEHVEMQGVGGGGYLQEEQVEDVVVGFETTSNLEINLEREKQQDEHEIKTEIATTKEIKSFIRKNPESMQTKIFETATTITPATTLEHTPKAATAAAAAAANKTMVKRTFKITPKLAANLSKPNKDGNGFISYHSTKPKPISTNQNHSSTDEILTTDSSLRIKTTTTTTTTANNKATLEQKHAAATATTTTATIVSAAITKTFESNVLQKAATATSTTLVKDKDLASNYNDNEDKRQISKTINETSNNLATTKTTTSNSTGSRFSGITNKNNKNPFVNTLNITLSTRETAPTIHSNNNTVDQQPPSNRLQDMMSHSRQSLQKDAIVKCTQTNSNECNSAATTATHRPDEIGRTPTIEATLEQTTASKTSTEIPEAAAGPASATTAPVIHKHEPLQLLVKDRHLIGTPLLMHKGENLMVTADELILPTNNNNAEQEGNNNSNSNTNNNEADHDLETNTIANNNKYKPHLEASQTTKLSAITTQATPNNYTEDEPKANAPTAKSGQEPIKLQELPVVRQNDLAKTNKSNNETKTKMPSLIMKKMTIITRQHEVLQHVHSAAESIGNEGHTKQFDNSHYQELRPLAANSQQQVTQAHTLKHSTVNTPKNADDQDSTRRGEATQPHTFQHEHELMLQQILQDQQVEAHAKLTKSEQWSDLRKAESKENHPGLIVLVSSGLFLVLLMGLMHVYRCDMPWRRQSPNHHLRPHQRHNHSFEDDSHSFLSYSEGMQKWHHSTRLEAPYNSPLHNLHVRELQKTSATEKPATVKSSATNYKPPALSHSIALANSRSLSQSSTTTSTSTASASSTAILDDESFYIEMTPDSGQFSCALQSELLPMELLNMAQAQTLDDPVGDSQTSMEDEYVVQYQQQQSQRRLPPHLTASTSSTSASASAALPRSASSAHSTTCLSVKPQAQSRRFGMW